MKILFEENELEFDELQDSLFREKQITVSVARLDKIHPIVSGNKLFKLHYFLEQAFAEGKKCLATFGGAYSNHLAATAYACKSVGISCIGIVRGERPAILSHTLKQCEHEGMQLHFVSRETFRHKDDESLIATLTGTSKDVVIVPEGGYHPEGANGAALIMDKLRSQNATHICTAVGTATTLAGLLKESTSTQFIIGIPVLKGMNDIHERISFLCGGHSFSNLQIFDNYHFGGYAKKTNELIAFMNDFYIKHKVPTDFVYTGKMIYAIMDKIKAGYFEPGSRIICLHTGGLQGNESLPVSTLVF
jgi:1-aminocyclopropane-1-carboxylate deaminase/D-cysteine desulfhydrase-like pyridoxal-dependent ACC family enzyme